MKRRTRLSKDSAHTVDTLPVRSQSAEPAHVRDGPSLTPVVQRLHETVGNRQTGHWLQAKMQVGPANDAHEQEADQLADKVMRMPESPAGEAVSASEVRADVQRKCACGDSSGSCAECDEEKKEEKVQRSAESSASISHTPPLVDEVIRSPGQPLDTGTRARMEERLGADFSPVRVHTEAKAAQSASQIGAAAYTHGHDVVFGAGKYAPGSSSGDHLIAHELVHVMQQSASTSPPSVATGNRSDPDEQQAEQISNSTRRGEFAPRYGEVAAHVEPGSMPSPSSQVSDAMLPSRSVIQRVELTYDDGPDSAGNTRTVLNELNAAGARATFYVVGKRVKQGDNWRVVFDIAATGHLLGNHAFDWNDTTDNHIFLNGTREERTVKILQTELAIREALIKGRNEAIRTNAWQSIPQANRDYIEDVIAHGTGRFRTPGFKSKLDKDGSATAAAIASASQILAASGLHPLEKTTAGFLGFEGVDVDPKDWERGRTQAEIETAVSKGLTDNSQSILLHSRIAATAAATPAIVADISKRKFTFDPTPQGAVGSVTPRAGFARLATISKPPTSAEIAQAKDFFRKGIPSFGGFIAGNVAIGIFQMAQQAGPAEVDSFAAEIRTTSVKTPSGPIPLANWMNDNPDWGTFAIFIETWRNTNTTPPPVPPKPTLPGATEIFFQFDRPHIASDTDPGMLTAEGRTNLASVERLLHTDPTLKVQLIGSCSSEGTEAYNYALGQRRAEFIAAELGADAAKLADPATNDLAAECHLIKAGIVTCGEFRASKLPNPRERRVLARFFR